jgi:hypothetical protein
LEDRTECAQDGLEDFDKHRGKMPTTSRAPDKSRENSARFDLVPSSCGGQATWKHASRSATAATGQRRDLTAKSTCHAGGKQQGRTWRNSLDRYTPT